MYLKNRRLYEEKSRRLRGDIQGICEEIANAFIDLSVSVAQYKAKYASDVSQEVWSEMCSLFVSGLPIKEIIENPEDIISEEDEISLLEMLRQETMNDRDFFDYHEKRNIWRIEVRNSNKLDVKLLLTSEINISLYFIEYLKMLNIFSRIIIITSFANFKILFVIIIYKKL